MSNHHAKNIVGFVGLALLIGGCSSVSSMLGTSSSSSSTQTAAAGNAANIPGSGTPPQDELDCPNVEVRTGAATLLIGSKQTAGDPSALDLRYQGTIVQTARECVATPPNAPTTLTMKVGIEGRVINGPAGGPGHLDIPLRLAVVHEGPQPRTVLSKLVRIPVEMAPGTDHVNFTHVEPDISFPMPKPAGALGAYIVYVGFDPNAGPVQKPKPPARKKR